MQFKVLGLFAAIAAAGVTHAAFADDKASGVNEEKHTKKIRMTDPMTTGMMKKGMMKGDVKTEAVKKDKAMQPMMEQEEKTMPQDKANSPSLGSNGRSLQTLPQAGFRKERFSAY
ncbi:MAG: hypothetical protein ACHP7O_00360 [Burkholderiales bacterium]